MVFQIRKHFLKGFLLLLLVSGCEKTPAPPDRVPGYPKPYRVGKTWYQPLPDARGFRQKGIASWYGKDFHGKRTSSGEIYDMHAVSAAHKTLPLGTYVRVKNLKNQRQIDVRINDRGPFVQGRIIDLSYGAAKNLGIVEHGTVPVEIMALGMERNDGAGGRSIIPVDYYSGNFTIQVGAFRDRGNAEKLKHRLKEIYGDARVISYFDGRETFYRVWVGKYQTLSQTEAMEQQLIQSGFTSAFAIAE